MTELDFDAIRDRRAQAERWHYGVNYGLELFARSSADVPPLLAEVERLQAELTQVCQDRDEAKTDVLIAESAIERLNQQIIRVIKSENRVTRKLNKLRDDLTAVIDQSTFKCSTCNGEGTVRCGAHVAGDGCEDLDIRCPDCPQPVTWAEAAQVAQETFAVQEVRRAALAERERSRFDEQLYQ